MAIDLYKRRLGSALYSCAKVLAVAILILYGCASLLPGNNFSGIEILLMIGCGAIAALLLWNVGRQLRRIFSTKPMG